MHATLRRGADPTVASANVAILSNNAKVCSAPGACGGTVHVSVLGALLMTDNQTLAFRRAHTVWASELAALSRWSPVVNGKTMNVSCDLPLAPQPQFRRHFGEDSTDMWYICADAWGVSEPSRPRLPPLGPSLHGLSHERDVIECELLQQPSDSNCALGESFRCELDSSVTTGARLANIVVQPGCKGRFRCGGAKVSCGHMEARAGRKAGLWQRMCRCVETRPLPFRTGKAGWPTSRQSEGCLAVSIGIGNEWGFEDGLADMGCTVHAFDPTPQLLLKHQRHTADPNNRGRIHFQPIGLGAEGYAPAKCGDDCRRTYGQVDRSATLPLDAILRNATAMHHTNIVDVLKIDCECDHQPHARPSMLACVTN
tara:strand:- start:461 stop:1567 length:1107 start_codon:yes stop_codon:yes gene_type:complete